MHPLEVVLTNLPMKILWKESIGKASTTLSLDLCPPASPLLQGHEMEMSLPLMVITLKLHPFHISYLFLIVK